jgi:hypothetical protein
MKSRYRSGSTPASKPDGRRDTGEQLGVAGTSRTNRDSEQQDHLEPLAGITAAWLFVLGCLVIAQASGWTRSYQVSDGVVIAIVVASTAMMAGLFVVMQKRR